MKTLDLDAVRAFVVVAELRSFTRAADRLDSTQSAISVRLKRLEESLGHQLIERTPRKVRLSAKGEIFLPAARLLLDAQTAAIRSLEPARTTLKVGISHHLVGSGFEVFLQHLHRADPALRVELQLASSRDAEAGFDRGEFDAALVLRHDDSRRDGEIVLEERFDWIAQAGWTPRKGEPLPLATQGPGCRLRAMTTQALDRANIRWVDVFVGGGVASIAPAVQAGVGVAALARRFAPAGTVEVGVRLGLPPLPAREVVLYACTSDQHTRSALRALVGAFRLSAGAPEAALR